MPCPEPSPTNQPTNKTKTKKAFTCLNMHCKYNYLLISTQNNNYICYFGVIRNQKSQKKFRSESDHQLQYEQNGKNPKKITSTKTSNSINTLRIYLVDSMKIIVNSFVMNAARIMEAIKCDYL